MIVKILASSATFNAVTYNTEKVDEGKGELLKVANFGALQALEHLKPTDYINYLKARSATSARTKYPQFHAAISCKGRSHTKEELAEIAVKWLKGMGYAEQPYLLVFHKDTDNNHVHIVSTRVDGNGQKIKDSYEKIRAYQVLNQVMDIDEKQEAAKNIHKALSYGFSTRAQFMMILESQGYGLKLVDGKYLVSRYGEQQGSIAVAEVDARIAFYRKNIDRLAQLRAITEKYRANHNPAIVPVTAPSPEGKPTKPTGYTSELADLLASKFGVQVLFHGKAGMPPYGYTVLDHAQKAVYKGGDLMPLAEFIKPFSGQRQQPEQPVKESPPTENERSRPIDHLETDNLPETAYPAGQEPHGESPGYFAGEYVSETMMPEINLDLAPDIDDEAILGRNRRRKRKARTNTR